MELRRVYGAPRVGWSDLRRKILLGLQRSCYFTGLAGFYARIADCGGFLALMYHSVPDPARAPFIDPSNSIPADIFEEQLAVLKETCNVITLGDAVNWLRGALSLPRNAVVITFDDGYLDNYEVAAPLLAKYGLPAALFVCTGYVDRQEPQWIDELYTAFMFRQTQRLVLPEDRTPRDLGTAKGERDAYQLVSAQLLTQEYAERRRLLNHVKAELKPSREPPRLTLQWMDLRAMQREFPNVELGLHTHDHVDLSRMPLGEAIAEVRRSQEIFVSEIRHPARYLTYPYGRLMPPLVDHLADLGIEAAFVTQPTDRVTERTGVYMMPRYGVTRSLTDLKMWSRGALPGLGRTMFGRVAD